MIIPVKIDPNHLKPILERIARVVAQYGNDAPVMFAALGGLAHDGEIENSSDLIAALDILLGDVMIEKVLQPPTPGLFGGN